MWSSCAPRRHERDPVSKLLKLKRWMAVPEAAKHVSLILEEEVTEADMLRLALDGQVRLSVWFTDCVRARGCDVVPTPLGETTTVPGHSAIDIDRLRFITPTGQITWLAGIWDLLFVGSARVDVENRYQELIHGPGKRAPSGSGIFVENFRDGSVLQVQEPPGDFPATEGGGEGGLPSPEECHYFPACKLPDNAMLVFRTDALQQFEQSLSDEQEKSEKPLHARTRRGLLTIIAALGKAAEINLANRSATREVLKWVEALGASLDDDFVRASLNEIPDAVESRKKS